MEKIFKTLDNNYLRFENNIIDVIIDNENNIWFNGNQFASALGYSDTKQVIKRNIEKEDKIQLHKINKFTNVKMGHPQTLFISEEGVYDIIIMSKKKLAKKIRKWITHEVLPSIRKYGYYKLKNKYENEKIDLFKQINYLKKLKNQMKLDLKKEKFPNGGLVYVIDYSDNELEAYRIGMTTNMNKRKQIYNTHNLHNNKIVFFKKSACPIRLETCVRAMLYDYRYKNRKDFYLCDLSIIKKAFKSCIKSISCLDKQTGGSSLSIIDEYITKNHEKKNIIIKNINKLNYKLEQ